MVGGSWARTGVPAAVASATYDAANRQLTFGGAALSYDLNGNLLNDGVNAYTWDARNRLATITGPASASFVYAAAGRRQGKTIDATTMSFVYDGLNPVQEQSGTAVANLLTGLGIDEFYIRADAGGPQTFLTDALGSTVALTDPTGAVQATYTYEPFGTTAVTGTTANSYDYTGRETDGTGLKYYRARYYHPTLSRFISEDPLEFAAGDVNLYAYVSNDPLDFVDPLGLDKQKQCGFAERFWKNFWTINDPLVRRPLLFVGGLVVGGEFTRLTGVPGPLKWTVSGMPRLQGYVPIARTLGIVGAGATTYTFAQSAATVAAAGALRGGLVFTAFEIGVIFGSAVNAAAVQPLLGPYLGITGCEG